MQDVINDTERSIAGAERDLRDAEADVSFDGYIVYVLYF